MEDEYYEQLIIYKLTGSVRVSRGVVEWMINPRKYAVSAVIQHFALTVPLISIFYKFDDVVLIVSIVAGVLFFMHRLVISSVAQMARLCRNVEFLLHVSVLVIISTFFYFVLDTLSSLNLTSFCLMGLIMVLTTDARYVNPTVYVVVFPITIVVFVCVTILLLLSLDRLVDYQIDILSKPISLRSLIIDKFILFIILALRIWHSKLTHPHLNIFLCRKENET